MNKKNKTTKKLGTLRKKREICLITFPDSIRTHDAMTLMLVMVVMAIAVGMATAAMKERRKRDKKDWCKWDVYKSIRKMLISFPFLFCFYIANVFDNHSVHELGTYFTWELL